MRKSFKSKLISSFMSATMVLSLTAGFTKFDSPVKAEAAATDYGLASNCQDGNILHCFGWKFSDIIDELPNIAAAGFTSVQTTPVQPHSDTTAWYWLYQPTYFTVGNDYCTADDVKRLCSEADKYGIKVIVDVVANHVAGKDGNYNGGIDPDLKNSECFTNSGIESKNLSNEDWKIRSNVVRCNIGMPDLNSNSKTVQNKVKNLVQELKSYGVDGIRWDAAKHIGLPSDGYSFWDNVIDKDMYNYGEILDSPGGNENAIMKEYSQYMTVTDNRYGNSITGDIRDGKTSSQSGNWINSGVSANKILNWGESHDTYCNDPGFGGWTKYLDESIIQRSYAVTAARANSNDLYFVRPYAKESNDIHYGVKGTESFKDAQIAAVNHLHNKMIGQNEYLTTGDNCDVVTRGNKTNVGGASIVNVKGGEKDFSVPNGGSLVPVGTYKDQVSGGTITVTASTISGHMGSTGIAVIYTDVDPEPSGSVSASLADGSSFENQTTVTLNCKDVKNATYSTSEGASGSYTDGKQITIGSSIAEGSSVKLTLKATKSDNTQVTKTYTYNKKAQKKKPTLSGPGFIYDNSKTNWSSVTAYVYDETSGTAISNAGWPGVQMTDAGDGYFTYVLDSKFANSSKVQVIFSNNGASQNPGSQQPGYAMTGSQYKIYENGAWSDYQNPSQKGTVTVKYVDESGNQVATSQTMTGNIGDAYTTSAATVSGYTLKTTPSNAAGKYTSSSITVTYVYSKVVSTDPVVTTSLADKSTFTTETAKTTLTLVNAVKGTYTIDNGITKEFTGSTEVVIGEGLVGNKDVTLDCTATDSKGVTKSYKYTFTKKFTVKKSTSAVAAASTASNSELPEKYYNTNGNGVGKEATIKIDGDASDWSEDMKIAQGAAWDVANHWKGGHENCVLDTYALYGAWDNDNLYIGWQMVNTTDTWARSGDGPLSDGGRVLDVPLILALSLDENSTSMSNKNTSGGSIWGQKMGLEFDTHVDRLLYMSGKPGLGKPSMFKAVDSEGNTDYTDGCVGFSEGGIEYKMATTNINSSIWGLNSSDSPSDVTDESADWVDYKTFTGSAGKHDTTYDSFYEIKIPFETLGITKSDLENNGIGAMLVATRGESAMDCIPYDLSMIDNATGDYTSDPSTSAEKDDIDVITAPLAKIGKSGGGNVTIPLQVNFGSDVSAPQYTNVARTLSATAYGGTAPYSYEFYVDGTKVATKSGSSTVSTAWTPTSAATHKIKCVVKDAAGNTVTSEKTFTAENKGTVVESLVNTSNVSQHAIVGQKVVLKGSATGGDGNYKFAYYYRRNSDKTWKVAGTEWGTSQFATFKPGYADVYEICIKVQDGSGTIIKKYLSLAANKTENNLECYGSVSKTMFTFGNTITIKGSAKNNSGAVKYKYEFRKASSWTFETIKDYSSSRSVSWKAPQKGSFTIRITADDGTNKAIRTINIKVK